MLAGLNAVVPMVCVSAAAIAAMTAEAFRSPGDRMPIAPLGAIGLIGAAAAAVLLWNRGATSFGVVTADNFGLFLTLLLALIGLLSLALSAPEIDRGKLPSGEYYALMLFAIGGMMLMATASDLLLIFLALEILSLAVYVLTGIRRDRPAATEAAFKYFLLGGFASAFFLYGIALTYAATGVTQLDRIADLVTGQPGSPSAMLLGGVGLMLVGFAFKVSAVPFHMWTPDAYEGAPASVAGFMSTGVKAAVFAAFVRVFPLALGPLRGHWSALVWAVAAATMVVGTVAAVAQSNVKRMLAYSSIAHAGYLLVALLSAEDLGVGAMLFYLVAYAVSTVGAFGLVGLLADEGRSNDQLADYAGLWSERPALAVLMTVFLLSLGGFPPLGGFVAKWYVFAAAIEAGHTGLAVIGVLTSVVSVFFYLRVVVAMYMTRATATDIPPVPLAAGVALLASAALVVYLGMLPSRVIEWAAASAGAIR
jgi:NADH-quinone oxidoreductase subunit N